MKIQYILSVALLVSSALISCTDLNEQLYDKVSMNDYGKNESEVSTIVGGAYASLRGYGSGTPEGDGVNCYPTCEYVFFTTECSIGMMVDAIRSFKSTLGMPTILAFCRFGVTTLPV